MRAVNHRVCGVLALCLLLPGSLEARASLVSDLRPVSDTFVVDPGSNPPHAKMIGIEDCDFGGAGSRAVAAAAAHVSTATAPNNQPHGYFRSLLRFDASSLTGTIVDSTTLSLYTTRVMTGGKDIFNPASVSGAFHVSLLTLPANLEWTQGYGAPETLTTYITDPTTGLSDTLLDSLLANPAASLVDVATLNFDASLLDPIAAQTWMNYTIDSPALNEAISQGKSFTLLLSSADDAVSFNFSCRNQNNTPGDAPTVWDNGPILRVSSVPEPAGIVLAATSLLGIAVAWRRSQRRRAGQGADEGRASSARK